MTPRSTDPIQAERGLRDYRAAHKIVPVGRRGSEVCSWDDIPVYRIKSGWRHEPGDIRILVERAPVRFPNEVAK